MINNKEDKKLEALRDRVEKFDEVNKTANSQYSNLPQAHSLNGPCPNCGYCPYCGRSGYFRLNPYTPYWYTSLNPSISTTWPTTTSGWTPQGEKNSLEPL